MQDMGRDAFISRATVPPPAHPPTMVLPSPERVEQFRRSVAMLPPGAPALNREKALALHEQLLEALEEVERLREG